MSTDNKRFIQRFILVLFGIPAVVCFFIAIYIAMNASDRSRNQDFIDECRESGFSSYNIGNKLVCLNEDDRVVSEIYG